MGTYTSRTRVQALAAKLPAFASDTTITANQVDGFIVDVEAEINSALAARGVSVPVSSPDYFRGAISKLATEGVAATVLKAWFQDSTGPNSEGAWAVYERRYRDGLAAIRKGEIPHAVDEEPDRGISSFQLKYPDGVDAGAFGSASDPMFSRDEDW